MIDFSADYEPSWHPDEHSGQTKRCIIISSERNLAVDTNGSPLFADLDDSSLRNRQLHLIGTFENIIYFAARVPHNNQFEWLPLRSAIIKSPPDLFIPISRAAQILDFHDDHMFCGRCGHRTSQSNSDSG